MYKLDFELINQLITISFQFEFYQLGNMIILPLKNNNNKVLNVG